MFEFSLKKFDFRISIILTITFILILFINYKLNINIQNISIYLIGSFFNILLISINRVEPQINSDYIQTGEGAICSFFIYIFLSTITDNIYLIFLLTFLSASLIQIFISKILALQKNEYLINGIIIQLFIVILISYLIMNDKTFNINLVTKSLLGYANFIEHSSEQLILLLSTFSTLTILFLIILPEAVLFSHGKSYFYITGFKFSNINIIMVLLRTFLITIIVILLGWLGSAAYYLYKSLKKSFSFFESSLAVIIFTQILIMINSFTGSYIILIISVSLSYIFNFIYSRLNRKII